MHYHILACQSCDRILAILMPSLVLVQSSQSCSLQSPQSPMPITPTLPICMAICYKVFVTLKVFLSPPPRAPANLWHSIGYETNFIAGKAFYSIRKILGERYSEKYRKLRIMALYYFYLFNYY